MGKRTGLGNPDSKKSRTLRLAQTVGYTISEDGKSVYDPNGEEVHVYVKPKDSRPIFSIAAKYRIPHHEYIQQVEVHRLQGYLKYGEDSLSENWIICHKNDNVLDNSWDNLYLGTHQSNMKDKARNGKTISYSGLNHSKNKLTLEQVLEIRKRYDNGEMPKIISKEYPVGHRTIERIGLRERHNKDLSKEEIKYFNSQKNYFSKEERSEICKEVARNLGEEARKERSKKRVKTLGMEGITKAIYKGLSKRGIKIPTISDIRGMDNDYESGATIQTLIEDYGYTKIQTKRIIFRARAYSRIPRPIPLDYIDPVLE